MFTIHNLKEIKYHGHLTSHNVFVDIRKLGVATFSVKIRLADLETFDLMTYANMFFDYRIASAWSAPEVLQSLRKINEPTTAMDVYSFGQILWELWHQSVPFDNHV